MTTTRAKPLVLIVDDEGSFLEIMSIKLKAAGYDTATARNAEEGIKQTEKLMPNLVLMDIHMPPGPTGTDAALTIKQNPKTKDTKIAFLTSLKDPWPSLTGPNLEVSKELGMDDFIEKTEDLNKAVEKVKEILARK